MCCLGRRERSSIYFMPSFLVPMTPLLTSEFERFHTAKLHEQIGPLPTTFHDAVSPSSSCPFSSTKLSGPTLQGIVMTMAITKEGTAATNEPYPSADADHSVTHAGWKITTRKLPILKAGPIEEMTEKLGITPPEMIFGDNLVRVEHLESGWNIEFNAFDALDLVDKTGDSMLKVSYSKEWQKSRYLNTRVLRIVFISC